MNQSIQSAKNSLQWTELYDSVCISYGGRFMVAFLLTLLVVTPLHTVYGAEEQEHQDSSTVNDADPSADDSETVANEPVFESEPDTAVLEEDTPPTDNDPTEPSTQLPEEVEFTADSLGSAPSTSPAEVVVSEGEELEMSSSSNTEVSPVTQGAQTTTTATTSDSAIAPAVTAPTNMTSSTVLTSTTSVTNVETVRASTSQKNSEGVEADAASSSEHDARTTTNDSPTANDATSSNDNTESDVQGVSTTTSAGSTSTDSRVEPEEDDDTAALVKDIEYTNNENRYQFSENSCVAVADGGYYCVRTEVGDTVDTQEQIVYAVPQTNGFSDIFIQSGNGEIRLTDNQYDDTAPYFDSLSQSVVWHRSVNDVYQVVSYDLTEKEEVLLTNSGTNNMQPVRSGEVTVWQRWVNNAWQVMVQVAGEESQQVTKGAHHNIAPYVNGEYVIWNVVSEGEEKQVGVYEISSGNVSYIDDADGGQVSNPRFVLMYDTKFTNGDIVTKGFDPETGQVIPLAAVPAPEPPDIPESDPVGETRALLNNKSNNEEDELDVTIVQPKSTTSASSSSDAPVDIASAQSTSTASTTLDLSSVEVATTTNSERASSTDELSDYDLPIAPFSTTTESVTATSSSTATTS